MVCFLKNSCQYTYILIDRYIIFLENILQKYDDYTPLVFLLFTNKLYGKIYSTTLNWYKLLYANILYSIPFIFMFKCFQVWYIAT